jgi:tetratricopeptide (TPR) repeat protein
LKNRSQKTGHAPAPSLSFRPFFLRGPALAVCLSALVAAVILYGPALHGPFLFDDLALPFQLTIGESPLSAWLSGVRPVLMFSYWLNHQVSPTPFGYHVVNAMIHGLNTALVFAILGRLLLLGEWTAKRSRVAAGVSAAVFLVHPLATESVSYIAGRSESLGAFFVLVAYALFLYRREAEIRWRDAVAILALFALGVATKENMVAFAGVLVLTDWMFPRASSRRLYLLLAPAALAAVVVVLRMLTHAGNAGFSLREFTWYQYSFTQARAIFAYLRLAILPIGLSVDHDFPISYTILQHGAWLYALALAALVACAIRWQQRYALACFGLLMFLVWLAPTSSVIPIADPLVERRMYLPLVGLILIACDILPRVRFSPPIAWTAAASGLLVLTVLTWDRNTLWGRPEELLASAALQAANNPRPVANLTETLIANNRCQEAFPWLERADRLLPRNYVIDASWGRALECVGRREEALARLTAAVSTHPNWKLFELIGLLYSEMDRMEAAGDALRTAIGMEPRAGSPHRSLALWYEARHDPAAAIAEYRAALAIDPNDTHARIGLGRAQTAMTTFAP